MARNLLCEHRLSLERFSAFSAFAGKLAAFEQIHRALEEYQEEVRPAIKTGLQPAYARADNANNMVELPKGSRVGTVLDLTRLGRIYAEAKATFRLAEFRSYTATDPRNYSDVNEFLAGQLDNPARREPFLKALFGAWARYRRRIEDRLHPTWAAEWGSLRPFLDPGSPRRWLQAVGVPRDGGVWLAILCYPLKDKKREIKLFRPTQLDAGWYAHHFPSPPDAVLSLGGHTMFLNRGNGTVERAPGALVSEYLHAPVDFSIRDWHAAGGLVGFTGQPIGGMIEKEREAHWLLLQSFYDSGRIREWMPAAT
jgi:hypothetical protein